MKKNVEKVAEEINISDIKRMIPHRYPFLLIDKVVGLKLGKSAIGIKNVTINEPYFDGHFPSKPIMPGVLIIESMAQTAAILVVKTLDEIDNDMLVYFMSMDNTKFRKLVVPGDTMYLHVEVLKQRKTVWKFYGKGIVNSEIVAESEFTAMMVSPSGEMQR